MKILQRYIFREYLIPLGYCLMGFVSIYVLFELFGSFSRLIASGLPFKTVVRYFLGYLSPFFAYLAPAALMLAAIYTMWNFCRHSELVAMKAGGVGFWKICSPIIAVALAMAAFVAWVNEVYVPDNAQWAKSLRSEKFDLNKAVAASDIVFRNAKCHRVWTAGALSSANRDEFLDVRVDFDRPSGFRDRRLVAKRAAYLDGEWYFFDSQISYYDVNGAEIAPPGELGNLKTLGVLVVPELNERPSDIMTQNCDWRYTSVRSKLRQLRNNINLPDEVRRGYVYDVYSQLLAPFACLVVTLFALPAGVASGRQSVFKGVLGALGMFFGFYALSFAGMAMARCVWVPPLLAAVLPTALFLWLGIRGMCRQL